MATTKAFELGQLGSKLTIHSENITLDGNVHGQYAGFDSDFTVSIAGINSGSLSEGTNLYYTDARADARIAAADTGDLSEGSNLYYTDARADARVSLIVDAAPGTLNTLNELAAALGDDASFSTTVTNSIATKLPLAGGTLTGLTTVNMGAETSPLRVGSTGNDAAVAYSNASTPTAYNVRAGMSDTDDFSIWTSDTKRLTVKDNGNPIVALAQTGNTIDIAKRWKLSKVQATMLDFLVKNKNNTLDQKKVEDMIADGVDKELISALATLQGKEVNIDAEVPNFPITGADLIAKGMKPGPEIGAKLGQLKQKWKDSNFKSTKDELLKENSDLSTQRGRLEYYLKKPVEDGMLVHLSGLGKFHKGDDTLADIVPERNGMYALHPDKWESTFYSLTNKDFKKIVHYKPTLIKAPADMIVADMAIANRFYRTDNPEEQEQLAKEYKDSIGKDISSMKMPEVIISTNESLTEAVHRFMTGHGVTFAGKKHDEIEIEVTGTDNVNKKYMVTILAPKELFGKQTQISSKYMNRGPWTKTKVDNVFGGE